MRATESINLIEQVLRDLIREIMGESWQQHPGLNLAKLEEKRDADGASRRGVVGGDDIINFLEFYHLQAIIEKNWHRFEPALGKKKYFTAYMDRLEGLRNPAMHSRDLLPFEEQLVLGITGELRNLVTIFRSEQGPDMNYYPEITQIVDITHGVTLPASGGNIDITLRPGDVVEFRCVATDPQARPIHWQLDVMISTGGVETIATATGDEVIMTWPVAENNVREAAVVAFSMTGDGKYHRHGHRDAFHGVHYRVDPPL